MKDLTLGRFEECNNERPDPRPLVTLGRLVTLTLGRLVILCRLVVDKA